MKTTFFRSVLLLSTLCLLLSACNLEETETPNMANPAAVFCKEQGYDYEIRTDESGNEYGVCIFPDGSECDAWAYYESKCEPGSTETEESADMPNPAAVYCKDQGYEYEIRTDENGGQYGVCIFPDGSECDEWAYYEGECEPGSAETGEAVEMANPAAVYCVDQGYDYEIRTDENGGQYGVCVFPDRSECEGWAYYNGECGPGDFPPDETGAAQPKETEASNPAEMTYEDEAYGITVTYPEGWTLEASSVGEAAENHPASRLLEFSKDHWMLIVHYKSPEDVTMIGGGMGAGEIVQDDEIVLLGQSVPVNKLVYEGKTKMIYVAESLTDLEIYAGLSAPNSQDYSLIDIPEEIWSDAAAILGSLTTTAP